MWDTVLIPGGWTSGCHPEVTRMSNERNQNVKLESVESKRNFNNLHKPVFVLSL